MLNRSQKKSLPWQAPVPRYSKCRLAYKASSWSKNPLADRTLKLRSLGAELTMTLEPIINIGRKLTAHTRCSCHTYMFNIRVDFNQHPLICHTKPQNTRPRWRSGSNPTASISRDDDKICPSYQLTLILSVTELRPGAWREWSTTQSALLQFVAKLDHFFWGNLTFVCCV